MTVENYFKKHFYDWANIVLVSKNTQKILYLGDVGNCKCYLNNKVSMRPIRSSMDMFRIEIIE